MVVNLGLLNRLFEDGEKVDFDTLKSKGVFSKKYDGFKVLGNGNLDKKIFVKADFFSKSALEKIKVIGGTAEVN